MADRTVVLSQNGRHAVRGLSVNNPSEFSAYQDDDDDLTYIVDLSAYLDGATITVVTRVPQGVFISNSSNTTTRLTQRLRGFGYVDFKVQTSAGDVEEFRINILRRTGSKVVLGASGGGGTGITPGDYGDISISAGNVWTIDPLAVTTAKIAHQAVTFGKFQHIAQNEVVGRVAAGTGDTKALSANEVIDVVNAASNTVDSTRVSFTQAGTGASTRTVDAKLKETKSLKDFGAAEDGVTNDTAAWNLAIAALNAGQCDSIMLGGVSSVLGALNSITRSGVSIVAPAASASYRIDQKTDNVTTLTITPSSPSTGRISDVSLVNLTVWNNNAAPTGGTGIKIIRADRFMASNIDIRNFHKGVSIEGGADQKWSNISIAGPFNWSSLASGSYCLRFEVASYGAVNEVPGEIFFVNGNIKGAGSPQYLQTALIINAGDGLWFSNVHLGFGYVHSCLITPSGTSTFIDSIKFVSCYFDGNFNTTGSGVVITGTAAGVVTNVDFANCTVKLHGLHGVQMTGTGTVRGIRFNGGMVEQNGYWGALVGSQTDVSFIGVDFINNNTANVSADVVAITGATNVRVQGCSFRSGTFTHPFGVTVNNTSANVDVSHNKFGGITTPMLLDSSTCSYRGNQLIGGIPSVAAAAALALPVGFDSVEVTGNTNITSLNGANVKGHRVRLRTTGTPTISHGSNLALDNGQNFTGAAGAILDLENDGSAWREVSRSHTSVRSFGSVVIGTATTPLSNLSAPATTTTAPIITLPDTTNPRYSVGFGSTVVGGIGARLDMYAGDSGSNTANLGTSHIRMSVRSDGNVGIGTTSFGTSAAGVLAIANGTEPSTGPADTVQFYSVDRSAGNTIPAIYCEGTGVTNAGITSTAVTHKVALKVNGTVYYLLATTNAT